MRNNKVLKLRTKIIPKVIEILIPAFVATLLGAGFTMMVGNAFSLKFSFALVLICVAIGSVFFTAVHNVKSKFLSAAVIVLTIAALLIMVHNDYLHLEIGWWEFLYYVKRYVYYDLPGDYPVPILWKESVCTFLIMYDLIAASVTTFFIAKRKFTLLPIVLYLPLLWCSIANTTVTPTRDATVIAASGVIMLLFVFAYRKKKKATSERALLVLGIPVLLYAFVVGLIFPTKYYKQDRLANDILLGMRDFFSGIDSDSFMIDVIDKAIYGNEDPHPLTEKVEYNPFTSLNHADNDLTKVGPFDPPEGKIMTVYKDYNISYLYDMLNDEYHSDETDLSFYTDPCYCLYLKVESLDTYKENKLTNSYYTLDSYSGIEYELTESPYYARIEPLLPSNLAISPYYHELYISSVDASEVRFAEEIDPNTINMIFFDDNAAQDGMYIYPAAGYPVKMDDLYNQTYEEAYVYGIASAVPERTRDALIMSGSLPDWYLDIYFGRSEMSDCDKVRAVTEYVRSLHPYDVNTEYPPNGVDFVPWFVTNGKTGICVHYATTTVILLRMIGIPARYVRGYVDPRSYPGTTSTVYSTQAHGWFEFYVSGYGWIMGDSTPGMDKFAKHYNIDAVAAAYPEIEDVKFSRTRFDVIEDLPADDTSKDAADETSDEIIETEEEDDSGFISFLLTALLVIVLATAFSKLVWWIFWKIRFAKKDPGDKILERYHFFNLMSKYLKKGLPTRAMEVVYKVTFSHEEITDDDLKKFIRAGNKGLALVSARLPIHKKILFKLISFKVRS
ncbi:MAG: transglutaminase domain-containing protein [Clostridiales bacterium]|nr:transglutaminase domain-containing protein [Clostridiales bacterium]